MCVLLALSEVSNFRPEEGPVDPFSDPVFVSHTTAPVFFCHVLLVSLQNLLVLREGVGMAPTHPHGFLSGNPKMVQISKSLARSLPIAPKRESR